MIALRPLASSVTNCTSSCASKSGKPSSVVIAFEFSGAVIASWGPRKVATLRGYEMGRPRGLEPPTPGTTNQCSNQLSYDRLSASNAACRGGFLRRRRHLGLAHGEGKRGQGR